VIQAQQPPTNIPGNVELNGYAWSSTIGWISLNCKTGGTSGSDICLGSAGAGPKSDYRVTLNRITGVLSGYAWSSNIGWIRFGGLSSFPTGGGTVAQNARVTGAYPNLNYEGWARACAGTNSTPGNCSNMTNSTSSGGWDGWISFRGTTYGISTTDTAFDTTPSSFAWGSTVVGWIEFSQASLLIPVITLTATPCSIAINANTCNTGVVSWNISSASSPSVLNSTNASRYGSVLVGTTSVARMNYGNNVIVARDGTRTLATRNVTADCVNGAVYNATSSTCVAAPLPAPTITLNVVEAIVRSSSTVSVQYTISRALVAGETCTVYGPGMPPGSVTLLTARVPSSALKSKTRFTMICTGPFGTVNASDSVDIVPSFQEV